MRRALLLCLLAAACARPETLMHRLGPPQQTDDVVHVAVPEVNEPESHWWFNAGFREKKIMLDVGADGRVTDTRVLNFPTAPHDPWVEAATRWRFTPGWPRRRLITFVTVEAGMDRQGPPKITSRYQSPLTEHVTLSFDNVARLERTNGRIEEQRCPLHHVVMPVVILPIHYSGIPPPPPTLERRAYARAFAKSFPRAADYIPGPCQGIWKNAEVYICPLCMKARAAWLDAHGGEEPAD